MSGLGLGHGTHVPLPLPVADDVGSVVVDGLTLSDLAQQAAPGRIVDLDIKDGWISSLVRVEEAVRGRKRSNQTILVYKSNISIYLKFN